MECQFAAAGMIPGATIHAHPLKCPDIVERLGIKVNLVRSDSPMRNTTAYSAA